MLHQNKNKDTLFELECRYRARNERRKKSSQKCTWFEFKIPARAEADTHTHTNPVDRSMSRIDHRYNIPKRISPYINTRSPRAWTFKHTLTSRCRTLLSGARGAPFLTLGLFYFSGWWVAHSAIPVFIHNHYTKLQESLARCSLRLSIVW